MTLLSREDAGCYKGSKRGQAPKDLLALIWAYYGAIVLRPLMITLLPCRELLSGQGVPPVGGIQWTSGSFTVNSQKAAEVEKHSRRDFKPRNIRASSMKLVAWIWLSFKPGNVPNLACV